MKNFKMKTQTLSASADIRIRRRLFIAQIKKNLASFGALKFAVPALALGIFALGMFQVVGNPISQNIQETPQEVSQTQQEQTETALKYEKLAQIAQSRASQARAKKYARYSQLRLAKLRMQ